MRTSYFGGNSVGSRNDGLMFSWVLSRRPPHAYARGRLYRCDPNATRRQTNADKACTSSTRSPSLRAHSSSACGPRRRVVLNTLYSTALSYALQQEVRRHARRACRCRWQRRDWWCRSPVRVVEICVFRCGDSGREETIIDVLQLLLHCQTQRWNATRWGCFKSFDAASLLSFNWAKWNHSIAGNETLRHLTPVLNIWVVQLVVSDYF